jgi:hypothetical protein
MLIWSRFLYGVACLVGVVCLVTSNVGIGIVASIVMIVALWLRSTALDLALERATSAAAIAQENYTTEQQLRHRAEMRADMAEAVQSATESALIRVTALWSRTVRPTTAQRYAAKIMTLKGDPAALASAVMLSRAAADDLSVDRPQTVDLDTIARVFYPEHDGTSDAVPPTPAPDPSPWSLVPVWAWRTVAGAVVFAAGLFVWEVLV